jgi:hypothetical protein
VPDPAMDNSGRLNQFLEESIAELKPEQPAAVVTPLPPAPSPVRASTKLNKFAELADRVARSQDSMNRRADALSSRLDKFEKMSDAVFNKHESNLDDAEHGMSQMEEALSGLMGHNGGPNE